MSLTDYFYVTRPTEQRRQPQQSNFLKMTETLHE